MSESDKQHEVGEAALRVRPLPGWAWVLGAFCFPYGIFILLAIARVLRWRTALPLAVGSFAIFYMLASLVESGATFAHIAILWFYIAIGQFQYGIGRNRDLWSTSARRIWGIFGWVAMVLAVISLAMRYVDLHLFAGHASAM